MATSKLFVVLLLFCVGDIFTMETYYMDSFCGTEIDMITEDINTGRLSIDGSYVGECNVTIETWYTSDDIMFHFENFDIEGTSGYCDDNNFLQVFNGQQGIYEDHRPIHGLNKVCGQNKPSGDYVPTGRYVTFRYVNTIPNLDNTIDIIFTAFHTGYCYSYEYKCSNGRCIDDGINCNGYDPCGDGSDCKMTTGAIVGVIIGATFGVIVLALIVFIMFRNRRRTLYHQNVAVMPSPYEVTAATVVQNNQTGYGAGYGAQYAQPSTMYQVPTSIQQK